MRQSLRPTIRPLLTSSFSSSAGPAASSPSASATATPLAAKWHPPADGQPTGISLYNCVARQRVPLLLRPAPQPATWYSCGPTVYAAAHIGHASCYVKQDILQRTLRHHFHIPLLTAINITDIDDKIIAASAATGEPWQQLTARFEAEFWADLAALGCQPPNVKMRVSQHIPQIVEFVQQLLATDAAYAVADGSVYFAVDRHGGYGKLQRLAAPEAEVASPAAAADGLKRGASDFALWKGRPQMGKSNSHTEPHWPVPWSPISGRPGWHIECSAMASHLFGRRLDFHAGGLDLRFPHHENEEAQCCAHHGRDQWVNYWIHTGQLHVVGDREKMSKSLQNTLGVAELLERYTAAEFRMLCLLSNYQNQIEFGAAAMDVARAIGGKLNRFAGDCEAMVAGGKPVAPFEVAEVWRRMAEAERRIEVALRDNLDTAKSVEELLALVAWCNRAWKVKSRKSEAEQMAVAGGDLSAVVAVAAFVERFRQLWGVGRMDCAAQQLAERSTESPRVAAQMQRIVDGVLKARANIKTKAVQTRKQDMFLACDEIRDALQRAGVQVKDHQGGMSTWELAAETTVGRK